MLRMALCSILFVIYADKTTAIRIAVRVLYV